LTGLEKYANIIVCKIICLSTPSLAWGLVTKKGEKNMDFFDKIFTSVPILLLIAVVVFYVVIIPYLIGKAARERGRSFAGFFLLSIIFTPLISGLILALMGRNERRINEINLEYGVSKMCPYCANIISSNAKICMYCQKELIGKEKIEEITKQNDYINKKDYDNPYIVISDIVIREQPDISAKELIEINCNDIVNFLSEAYEDRGINNVWYKVKFRNIEGWCIKTSLKKLTQ
jgi:hypothetical protein